MKQISELRNILSGFLILNKSRLDCFTRMLLALFAVRTVNMREVAVAFSGCANISSRYRRIKRFFTSVKIDTNRVGIWVFRLFFKETDKVYLIIDRTNWFFGKAKINILTAGIAYEGSCIPLCWKFLNKAGNANAKEHIDIIKKAMGLIGKENIIGVLGDREFASGRLFKWINSKKLYFYIRIKDNSEVKVGKKKLCSAKKLFRDLNLKEQSVFGCTVWIYGQKLYLAGSRSHTGELMVVATNKCDKNAIAVYLRRWEIECFFQNLKGRGFRFEDTHIVDLDKINKLMCLLVIGFSWAHKVGEWLSIKKPIIFNRYRDSTRPQYSFFRYGFDAIREAIIGHYYKRRQFYRLLNVFYKPPTPTYSAGGRVT
jgi:hypothetical protein